MMNGFFKAQLLVLTIFVFPSAIFALDLAEVEVPGSPPSYGSPVIADVSPEPGLEVVVAGNDGIVHAVSLDQKRVLWSRAIPQASCSGGLMSSPSVGDLYGDGTQYVVIGYGGYVTHGCDGGVVAINGATGEIKWHFSTKAFAKGKFWQFSSTVLSTPTLAKLDNDNKMQVIVGSFDRNIYILENTGQVRAYYQAADTVFGSASVANIPQFRGNEVFMGSDISGNKRLQPPTKDGGNFMSIDASRGQKSQLITFRNKKKLAWLRPVDQVVQASSAIGNVTNSNPGQEVVIGSGCFFPQNSNKKKGNWVKVLSARSGKIIRTFALSACSSASPALGDLDGDGVDDIVTISRGEGYIGGDGSSHVYAFSPQKNKVLWDVVPRAGGANDEGAGNISSPIIADIDGNGSLEVMLNFSSDVVILNGADGQNMTCDTARCEDGRPRLKTGGSGRNTPAASYGKLVAFAKSKNSSNGAVFIWSGLDTNVASQVGTKAAYDAPWSAFRGSDPGRKGVH